MLKRQAYKLVILEPAKSRIARGECPGCGKPKSRWKRRTDWTCCSAKCTRKYMKYHYMYGWPDLRKKAFERDDYTCRRCGKRYPNAILIADHIVPIALGGAQWDIDNVQTLCIQCNKVKTGQDAGTIARYRRMEIHINKNQTKLVDFLTEEKCQR